MMAVLIRVVYLLFDNYVLKGLIQGFKNSGIQGFKNSGIQGIRDLGI